MVEYALSVIGNEVVIREIVSIHALLSTEVEAFENRERTEQHAAHVN